MCVCMSVLSLKIPLSHNKWIEVFVLFVYSVCSFSLLWHIVYGNHSSCNPVIHAFMTDETLWRRQLISNQAWSADHAHADQTADHYFRHGTC